jgi:hypothetical protein
MSGIAGGYMKKRFALFAVFLLWGCAVFSQEISPAEAMRASEGYQKTLAVFKEPSIFPASSQDAEVYRVFIYPTFYHALSIRVEKSGKRYTLVVKYLSGKVGYGEGTLKGEKRRRLTEKEWRNFIELLNQASFWSLPAEEEEPEPNEKGETLICLDGTSWYLEGVREGKYHAVQRYCPGSPSVAAVGAYMAKLSKLGAKAAPYNR